jgi:glycine oxidase
MTNCLIVGGGIIGLSLAYELSRRGLSVTVAEQGAWGGQASSAAAGMLAPLKEFSQPGPLLDLGIESLRLYPEWAAELEAEAGRDVQLCIDGLLTVALTEEEAEQLRAKFTWQRESGYDVRWLTGAAIRDVEPLLTDRAIAAIHSPSEGHVNNRMLLQALVTACKRRGVTLLSGCVVTGFVAEGSRVVGVETTAGSLFADETIIASGAWAGIAMGWLGLSIPVLPVRGQIAAVDSAGIPLRTVIFGSTGYITPKRDGKIVLGATEDEAGFQREVTLAGLTGVLNGAMPYVPALSSAPFLEAWAGLRPATADGKPLLGPVPGWSGLSLAGGHFRNGILLSPTTAKLMADYLEQGRTERLEPFLPERFTSVVSQGRKMG